MEETKETVTTGTPTIISSNNTPTPLLDYVEYTQKGYTSYTTTANQKVLIDSTLASALGISRQIYILNYITAKLEIEVKGLSEDKAVFKIVDSPNCGCKPDTSGYVRGYSYSENGDLVTLTTKITHIISDISGRSYDMYYPCKPAEIEWKYKVAYDD